MELGTAEPVVLQTLSHACSQDASVLKPAEQQLKAWETQPGFYSILSSIFCNYELDANIRWLAVLYCKNGVDRYWRKSAPNAIAEAEKEVIKARLISNFREPVPQIATQVAVLTGKIARLDCPHQWDRLVPTLLQAVRCDDLMVQQRGLLVLHHVTKTLASKRLTPDRKLFETLTQEIVEYMNHLWQSHLSQFMQLANQHDENMANSLEQARLVLKALRKLATYGLKEPHTNPHVMNFVTSLFPQLEALLDIRRSMWGNHQMLEKCERIITTMTKVLMDMLENHPASYVGLIKTTLQFVLTYNFTTKGLLFDRFTVHCFNLMKGILFCDTYKPRKNNKEDCSAVCLEAKRVLTEFFTFDTLSEVCRRLVSQYFLLTTDDLTAWEADPEEFCQEEGGDSYRYSLRPCTEVLFLTIFKEFRLTLTPVLLQLVEANQGPCNPDDMQAILKKDAVYNAVGLASFDLFDEIDYDSWFTNHLLKELQIKDHSYSIIRKRVVWLMGKWVGVKMSTSLRPALYDAIMSLLHKDEDLAVRLEAAQTLKAAVDEFEFSTEQLLPYIESVFSLLFNLLKEVRECDTKMHVLHVLSFVIERMGSEIRPYISSLVQYLPLLWEESAEHNMLRCAILTTLIHLVQGYGTESTQLHNFILPVIDVSTDTKQDQHIYLMEDGLELWHMTLLYAPTCSPALLKLFKNMPQLLELSTENLRMCLKITQMYILLGARDFMHEFSSVLATSLAGIMGELKAEGSTLILRVMELVLRAFPTEGPHVFMPMLPSVLHAMLQGEESCVLLAMQIAIFSRILLQNQEVLWSIVQHLAQSSGQESWAVLGQLLDIWTERIDVITQPERRKICGLALSSLLTLNNNVITERFGCIINTIVQVLHDVCRTDESGPSADCLVISESEVYPADDQDTPHDVRKRQLCQQDPVHTVSLQEYLVSQMTKCQGLHGQDAFNHLMNQVDPEVLKQLKEFVH
ncbi:importin-11-like [Babylonia areolata]|uniref:importin-11-like n=1 Tax=Babylonia areolata TaxID=304850 RepID=UPI003FD02EF1